MTQLPTDRSIFTTRELGEAGISRHRIRTLIRRGTLHRVTQGLYTTSRPHGRFLLEALQHQRPDVIFTGTTAAQLRGGYRITTPVTVLVARDRTFRSSGIVTVIRAEQRPFELIDDLRVATPLRVALDIPDDQAAVAVLDRGYTGRRARDRLEKDLEDFGRVPARLRGRINGASIGTDSETERILFRALRKRGYVFECNKLIGNYFRDGVYEPEKVIVEVHGHTYHNHINVQLKDYWKANDAVTRGYRHLSFSDICIDMHLERVVDCIVAVIEGREREVELMGAWHVAWVQPSAVGMR
ncbi:type IV toxin-antitoxin system AbiEi family antitoxin domain-containing protein [Corynebacterium sp.]|uniref:type IV toxin-antitoxin system AbiEi family antitoxin domain-containing protein n=1 Tax=Corynebacterium sp. TaxID=1720 RepID=UPI0026E01A35|nr:type IV toxin-antitoxin system AbiEi family antitoxin domain-containing protein [Corynebacterium sp.]MDO5512896.1 type IV toxin-antitoxin system AbiEi family antitoxin domain-containing protein [Corynebacterium sp.]